MTRHLLCALPSLLLCLLLCSSELLAQSPQCRTRCEASEHLDVSGCCASRPTPSSKAPMSAPKAETQQELQRALRLHAYHFSAEADAAFDDAQAIEQVIALMRQLGADPAPNPSERLLIHDQISALSWRIWLALEARLMLTAHVCAREGSECGEPLGALMARRAEWRERAMPLWRAISAPGWLSELEGEALHDAVRDQALYYMAAVELGAGDVKQGASRAKELMTRAPDSPYVELVRMSLADRLFEEGASDKAYELYLRSHQSKPLVARGYALYMEGWCLAQRGELQQAMRAMIYALEEATQAAMLPNRALLIQTLEADITRLYAKAGSAREAFSFYEALGIPSALIPVHLKRLLAAYEAEGRLEEAATLRKALKLE